MTFPNAMQNPYNGMDLQQMIMQQQYLNNAIQQEQNRQQYLRQQASYRPNQQSYQSQQVEQGLPGRIVNAIEEVAPNEVPMDGRVSIFPKRDYSSIFAKAWNSDGTIQTVEYVPKVVDVPTETVVAPTPDISNTILERLDNIEKLLTPYNNRSNNYNKSNNRQNNKKESTEDEQQ